MANKLTPDEHQIIVDAIHDSAIVIHKGQRMNEQIRELWLKAAREDSGDDWDSQTQFIERFAKLIIRECTGVCESVQLLGPYKDVQDATLKDASYAIKQHFGVE